MPNGADGVPIGGIVGCGIGVAVFVGNASESMLTSSNTFDVHISTMGKVLPSHKCIGAHVVKVHFLDALVENSRVEPSLKEVHQGFVIELGLDCEEVKLNQIVIDSLVITLPQAQQLVLCTYLFWGV
ncbi:hypothetical protein EDD15DRAFT_2197721 [Pisolithus albus]|nr:hypothetical protein EDD15DRAFT_2197721 [Pisolithus albus]